MLQPGELEVQVPHAMRSLHAEQKIVWFAKENGYQVTDIASSRPICMEQCFPAIPAGVRIHTPTQAQFDSGIRQITPYIKGG
jgi:hypothetical protein